MRQGFFRNISRNGIVSGLDNLDKSRVVVLNMFAFLTFFVSLGCLSVFPFIGGNLRWFDFVIPFCSLASLLLQYFKKYKLARLQFLLGSYLILTIYCFLYRRTGVEYTLIALACSVPVLIINNWYASMGFIGCVSTFIAYKIFDNNMPFSAVAGFNYEISSDLLLFVSVGLLFYEVLLYRDMVIYYNRKLSQKYNTLSNEDNKLKEVHSHLQKYTDDLESQLETKSIQLGIYVNAIDAHICSFVFDTSFNIVYVNNAMHEVCGINLDDILGKSIHSFFEFQEGENSFEGMKQMILRSENWKGELFLPLKGAKENWFDMMVFPVEDYFSKSIYYMALATPTTSRKKLLIEQERNLALYEKIAFKTSHELRTPIVNILGLSEVMEHCQIDKQEELVRIAQLYKDSAQKMDKITKEFLNFINQVKRR